MKRFLIIFRDDTPSTIVEARSRDDAMGSVVGPIASCEEIGGNFWCI